MQNGQFEELGIRVKDRPPCGLCQFLFLACGTPLLRAGQLDGGLDASDTDFSCVADIAACQGYAGLANEPALWPGQWLRGITDTVLSALLT